MNKERFSSIDIENLIDIIDSDGLDSLLKLINLKVSKLGESILQEDLKKTSFAQLGTELSKYQGAKDLQIFINNEVAKYKRQSIQPK